MSLKIVGLMRLVVLSTNLVLFSSNTASTCLDLLFTDSTSSPPMCKSNRWIRPNPR
ncbi:hypothetical protein COLO4_38523 [Corchorus olitorius]|uniref:Uncharacterized protein n=1 Tax=Corchorus olitorius TaxID=93759 RepID=A0A1R3FUE1_9ROSI|nr:hypothetical protein COLO4_38523 [Corchorus olitorius]